MIRLITGGARSGKSSYAESYLEGKEDVTYIATSQVLDQEMQERVKMHRERRTELWNTWETPLTLKKCPYQSKDYILDCLTIFTTNVLFDTIGQEEYVPADMQRTIENKVINHVESLISFVKQQGANLQIVTNEVGDSIVPAQHISRVFRDIQGRINQRVAILSDEVYLVVCGLPVKIK